MTVRHILFNAPCGADWEGMRGDGPARHCDSCDRKVHDLSGYTPEETEHLLTGGREPECVRVTWRPDGTVATRPGLSGLTFTASVLAATALVAMSPAQAATSPDTGRIVGTVARAPGRPHAPLRVTAMGQGVRRSATVSRDGRYSLEKLPPGVYRVSFASPHAATWAVNGVAVRPSFVTVADSAEPGAPLPIPLPPTAGLPMLVPLHAETAPSAGDPPAPPSPSDRPAAASGLAVEEPALTPPAAAASRVPPAP